MSSSILIYGVALLFYKTLKAAEDHRLSYHLAQLLEYKDKLLCTGINTNNGTSSHRNAC